MLQAPISRAPVVGESFSRLGAALRRHGARAALAIALALAASAAVTLVLPATYRAQALLRVGDWAPALAPAPAAGRDDEPAAIAARLLRSQQIAQPVARRLDLARDPDYRAAAAAAPAVSAAAGAASEDALGEALLRHVQVQRRPGGDLLALSVEDQHPAVAAALADGLIAELRGQMAARETQSAASAAAFLDTQLAGARRNWQAAEAALSRFRAAHPADAAAPGASAARARLDDLAQAVNRTEIDLWQQRAAQTAGGAAARLTAEEQRPWTELRVRRAELAAQASRLAAQYGPNALPLRQARQALASVEASLAQYRRATLAGHGVSAGADRWALSRLRAALARQQVWLDAAARNAAQDGWLAARAQAQMTLYESLWERRRQMAVSEGLLRNPVQVLAPARVPLRPIRPRWPVSLGLGLLAGILCAALLIGLDEWRAVARAGPAALAALRLPLLGSMPAIPELGDEAQREAPGAPRAQPEPNESLLPVQVSQPTSRPSAWSVRGGLAARAERRGAGARAAEADPGGRLPAASSKPPFVRVRIHLPVSTRRKAQRDPVAGPRSLEAAVGLPLPRCARSALDALTASLLLMAAEDTRIVLVAGAGAGAVSVLLARGLHDAGERVLLVDCRAGAADADASTAAPAAPGLGDYLAGDCALDMLLATAARSEEGPSVIGSGRGAFSATALAGPAMRGFAAAARQRWDWILLDGGPLPASPGARLLAAQADAAVLVARTGERTASLSRAAALLHENSTRLLGVVLHAVPLRIVRIGGAASRPAVIPVAASNVPAARARAAAG
ncbi:MAG TPA: hypothetical protein VE996_05265 [Terriglobales bacterium]|nr:hypothetical protein [Terriglobales bacterium]